MPEANIPMAVVCTDCGAPYGEDGWCDVVVPDFIWEVIAPEGGVLCFRCMTKRIEGAGLEKVPVNITSGPYHSEVEEWRMIGLRRGREERAEKFEVAFAAILGPELQRRCYEQDEQWGGPKHDDKHGTYAWVTLIRDFVHEASATQSNPEIYEDKMLDVAALAIKAIQSSRRKRNA
jgi:hypothetical protein